MGTTRTLSRKILDRETEGAGLALLRWEPTGNILKSQTG
jgi:hypothetical protein